jgi:hypothetical protein
MAEGLPSVITLTIDYSSLTTARALFDQWPQRVQYRLGEAMQESLIEVTKEIKDRVLVKSGTLRRSWNPELPPTPASGGGMGYLGRVTSNLEYAAFIEFGFHGSEKVRAHTRETKLGNIANVRAHERLVDYAGKPYARPGLTAAMPKILDLHTQAMLNAVTDVASG